MSANEYIQANDVVSKMRNRTLDCADCGQKVHNFRVYYLHNTSCLME